MSEMSNFLENALYDHVLRNTPYTSPATIRLALFLLAGSGAELEAGTLTNEVANANAYVRMAVTFAAPANGVGGNTGAVTWPTASGGNWGTVRFVAIMDSATHGAGNVLLYTQLDSDQVVNNGNTFQINVGQITATFA